MGINRREPAKPASQLESLITREWTEVRTPEGTYWMSGDFMVHKIEWRRPGFKRQSTRSGYALFHHGKQVGPAHDRAVTARLAAEHIA